jgi:hypothetical protein
MPAAIKPYSIAVAPDSHLAKAVSFPNITVTPSRTSLWQIHKHDVNARSQISRHFSG